MNKRVKWLEKEGETAMPRRKWDAQTKAAIVLQGLKGRPVADICTEHQISQAQYYQWRDQFMKKLPAVFMNTERRQASLERENSRLKKMIGELTVELKKLNEWSE
jgi:transposase-like protein